MPVFFGPGAPETRGYVYALFMLALTAVLSLALWFFPLVIARKLVASRGSQSPPSPTADTWLAMGCSLLGLWLLSTNVAKLVYDVFALNSLASYYDGPQIRLWILRSSSRSRAEYG